MDRYVVSIVVSITLYHYQPVCALLGTDCSMPMCSQGYYDPFCTGLPQAPGGEGCYRCSNGEFYKSIEE